MTRNDLSCGAFADKGTIPIITPKMVPISRKMIKKQSINWKKMKALTFSLQFCKMKGNIEVLFLPPKQCETFWHPTPPAS